MLTGRDNSGWLEVPSSHKGTVSVSKHSVGRMGKLIHLCLLDPAWTPLGPHLVHHHRERDNLICVKSRNCQNETSPGTLSLPRHFFIY